jgi:hypothetical protein
MRHIPHSLHFQWVRVGILQCRQGEVGGPFATVTAYFWREDSPWLVLQLPDGRRVAAPAAWTDLPTDKVPTTWNRPLLHAGSLLAMTSLCQRLRQARASRRRPT